MNVFISWSGERSKFVAEALREWLPSVLQYVKPFMSDRDIGAGSRGIATIHRELAACDFGIACVTPENVNEPWINFEAGALAKKIDQGAVVPYLIGYRSPSEVLGPLGHFQGKIANEDGTRDVLLAIDASASASALGEQRVRTSFETWWQKLEPKISNAPKPKKPAPAPSLDDKVDAILETVRGLARSAPAEVPLEERSQSPSAVAGSGIVELKNILNAYFEITGSKIRVVTVTDRGDRGLTVLASRNDMRIGLRLRRPVPGATEIVRRLNAAFEPEARIPDPDTDQPSA